MKQFESFLNKIPIDEPFTRDGLFHAVTLSGLPEGTKFVTVEAQTAVAGTSGVRAEGMIHGDGVWEAPLTVSGYITTTVRVNISGQIGVSADIPEINFAVTGAWGGDGVVVLDGQESTLMQLATGWTVANNETWRIYNTDLFVPAEDRGNVEAMICFTRPGGTNSSADVRAVGSSWNVPNFPHKRYDTVVKVNSNGLVEVYEGGTASKNPIQNSWVYFVGWILKGGFDSGSGTAYRYNAVLDPVDDGIVGTDAWETFNFASKVSSTATNVYWRLRRDGGVEKQTYAREVGSTNVAQYQSGVTQRNSAGFCLSLDENKEVEVFMPAADSQSYLFGYIDEYIRRAPRSTVISERGGSS
jgi:hypothetical protein